MHEIPHHFWQLELFFTLMCLMSFAWDAKDLNPYIKKYNKNSHKTMYPLFTFLIETVVNII